jgi:glucose/mannose transport system permease protein
MVLVFVGVYLFIAWTAVISLSSSKMVPRFDFVGLEQYIRLWSTPRWLTAVENLGIFTALFLLVTIALGLFMAILLDQKIRAEGFLRAIFLYPMHGSVLHRHGHGVEMDPQSFARRPEGRQ